MQLMSKPDRNALIALPILILIGWLFGLAGSQGGASVCGRPLFALLVALVFLIQWLVFIPSFIRQTEKYFDLTGSLTYLSVTTIALLLAQAVDARAVLLWAMVVIWAFRLGTFLFGRVRRAGKDARFDDIKPSFLRFLNVWTVQALWVTFTAGAALAAITTLNRKPLEAFAIVGLLIWLFGFAIEILADAQKSRFNADPQNRGRFIRSGLWARSRHPNYFGEIVLWIGVALVALPVLQGWQLVTLISPFLVALLLIRVSGIPLLEKRADEKWGGQADYEEYKQKTPVLIPRL
jgi:steroid 5-alpha reductase family enzyme